jgi:hypothetical protein
VIRRSVLSASVSAQSPLATAPVWKASVLPFPRSGRHPFAASIGDPDRCRRRRNHQTSVALRGEDATHFPSETGREVVVPDITGELAQRTAINPDYPMSAVPVRREM